MIVWIIDASLEDDEKGVTSQIELQIKAKSLI